MKVSTILRDKETVLSDVDMDIDKMGDGSLRIGDPEFWDDRFKSLVICIRPDEFLPIMQKMSEQLADLSGVKTVTISQGEYHRLLEKKR